VTLPELAIRRPITTLMLLISILVIGGLALQRLPLAFMPESQENNLFIIVNYPNASPQAVERMIVKPVEDAVASMNGIKHMWSRCDSGGGRVNVIFEYTVDIDLARTEMRERVDRIREDLPDDIERIDISSSWNASVTGDTILEGRISSKRDLSSNYDLLDRKIINPIERVPGVASVSLDGVNPREIKINLKLEALKRFRIDASQVMQTLRDNNLDRSLGTVRNQTNRFSLRTVGSFRDVDEIRNLPVQGTSLRLSDLADVTYTEPPLEYGRHLDRKFAVGVSVTKESSANTVEVTQGVRERIAKMATDPELEGIKFLVWRDQGREITKTIADLQQTGFIGAILACIVLFMFLRRASATVIAVMCIPFSLIVACGIIWAQGKTLNTISLLGLIVGVGMLVDNAVVVMENIDRYQRKGFRNRVAALLGAREVSVAVIAATLTSVIVFMPMIFSKPSEMNILLRELALTVCFTLLASLFISQTLIPLAAGYMVKQKERKQGRIMNWMQARYAGVLGASLRHKWVIPIVAFLVMGSVYWPFTQLEFNFQSSQSEQFVGMRYKFSEELPLEKKEFYVDEVESILEPHLEALHVDSIYSYWSDRWTLTRLYMEEGYTNESHMNVVRKKLPDLLPRFAGLELEVQDNTPFWQRNRGKRIGIQLRGTDSEVLAELAQEAKDILAGVPGLFDAYTSAEGGTLELHSKIDRDRARAYGIDLAKPAEVVELTFRGRRLPTFKGADHEVPIRLTLDEQEVESIDQLKTLPMNREGAAPIPLESFSEFSVVKGSESINRNNRVTSVWVGAKYDEGKKEDYMDEVQAKLSGMILPYGFHWEYNAFRRQERESITEALTNLVLALGLVFAVMAGLFESVRQAIALMVSLPFAVVGALWALHLAGIGFDQPAFVGLVLLLGIVVNNGIVMVEHINGYRRKGVPRSEAIMLGGKERLRPIIMTALTTLMGLVPMMIQKPALGDVYYYSMAYVIAGGLLVSTLLTLVFLPATICIVEDVLSWIGRIPGRIFRGKVSVPSEGESQPA